MILNIQGQHEVPQILHMQLTDSRLEKHRFSCDPIFFKKPDMHFWQRAATRSHSQPLTATRSHSQPHAATRSHSQPLAATPLQVSGRKWSLQKIPHKWLQVATPGNSNTRLQFPPAKQVCMCRQRMCRPMASPRYGGGAVRRQVMCRDNASLGGNVSSVGTASSGNGSSQCVVNR